MSFIVLALIGEQVIVACLIEKQLSFLRDLYPFLRSLMSLHLFCHLKHIIY